MMGIHICHLRLTQIASWGNAPCGDNRMVGLYVQDVTATVIRYLEAFLLVQWQAIISQARIRPASLHSCYSERSGYGVRSYRNNSQYGIQNALFKLLTQMAQP